MLKKAAIVAAAATITVLAMSPLAFADDDSSALVNASDNAPALGAQACNNEFPIQGGVAQGQVPVKEITPAITGALSLLGGNSGSASQTTTDNARTCGDSSAN